VHDSLPRPTRRPKQRQGHGGGESNRDSRDENACDVMSDKRRPPSLLPALANRGWYGGVPRLVGVKKVCLRLSESALFAEHLIKDRLIGLKALPQPRHHIIECRPGQCTHGCTQTVSLRRLRVALYGIGAGSRLLRVDRGSGARRSCNFRCSRDFCGRRKEKAPVGVEPTMADLQSAALATWLRRRLNQYRTR
jgi:hypothetical protein